MAELTAPETTAGCCEPERQATCCEPSAKDDCCGRSDGCSCDAGDARERLARRKKVNAVG